MNTAAMIDRNVLIAAALRVSFAKVATELPGMVRDAMAKGRRARFAVIEGGKL